MNESYLIFDTETTGLPTDWKAPISDLNNWPRLVQIAWTHCDNSGNIISESDYIVKPQGFIIPDDAVNVHGISTERANNEGIALQTVLNEFSIAISQSSFLVAHNMKFDERIVGAEFLRENIENQLLDIPKICTMELSVDYCRLPGRYGKYKWPSLADLHCKLFGVDFEEAHDAAVDVRACTSCLFELKNRGILTGDTSTQDELLTQTWTVPSDSNPSKAYTVQYSDYGNQTILKCNCPAWKFNTRKNRTCKHTDHVVEMHGVPQEMLLLDGAEKMC